MAGPGETGCLIQAPGFAPSHQRWPSLTRFLGSLSPTTAQERKPPGTAGLRWGFQALGTWVLAPLPRAMALSHSANLSAHPQAEPHPGLVQCPSPKHSGLLQPLQVPSSAAVLRTETPVMNWSLREQGEGFPGRKNLVCKGLRCGRMQQVGGRAGRAGGSTWGRAVRAHRAAMCSRGGRLH